MVHLTTVEAPHKASSQALQSFNIEGAALHALILSTLDDAKAQATTSISLGSKSSVADHMVICSGTSQRHVGAIADRVLKAIKQEKYPKPDIEGLETCDWVLIDAGDVIVHIFRPEVREFYNLEKLWGDLRPDESATADQNPDVVS